MKLKRATPRRRKLAKKPRRRKEPLSKKPAAAEPCGSPRRRKVPLSKKPVAAEPCDNKGRRKVRKTIQGIRIWVYPEDQTKFKNAMKDLRLSQSTWTQKQWKAAVYKQARASFGLSSYGGCHASSLPRASPASSHNAASPKSEGDSSVKSVADHNSVSAASKETQHMLDEPYHGKPGAANGSECGEQPSKNPQPLPDCAQPVAGRCIPLKHGESTLTAEYDASEAVAVMKATPAPGPCVPFAPQPVVNWLYQVLGIALSVIQKLLGTNAFFLRTGCFIDKESGDPACGGMLTTFWGTEMGARRDQALIAWDYDVDVAAFITPNFDFSSLWRKAAEILEPLGLRMFCHSADFKYRISPKHALAYNDWTERYQLAHAENPGEGRSRLAQIARDSRKHFEPLQSPSGANCLDLEVYRVKPLTNLTIKGSKKISVSCAELFPIVEGVFGPLRVPLPASPNILDAEYGRQWRHTRSAKVIRPHGRSRYVDVTSAHTRRCVWPSVPLHSCSELLGGFYGAGLDRSEDDVQWRFAPDPHQHEASVCQNSG